MLSILFIFFIIKYITNSFILKSTKVFRATHEKISIILLFFYFLFVAIIKSEKSKLLFFFYYKHINGFVKTHFFHLRQRGRKTYTRDHYSLSDTCLACTLLYKLIFFCLSWTGSKYKWRWIVHYGCCFILKTVCSAL